MTTLSPDRWQQVSPYLDQALSLPESERSAWVESFRAEKPELAELLQELLEEHRALAQKRFLEGSPIHDTNQSSLAGQKIGAYTLISPIGEGGMGSVWLAERSDGRFERQVAVKFLRFSIASAGGAERFTREGRILGQLAHPHIAELIDAGVTSNGEPYLVLEHVEGDHIDEYSDKRSLDVDARIRLFLDVASAVALAHANLIVHRDLKPSNVLVRNDGQVKLLDFGIAKLLRGEGTAAATLLTQEGGGALTPQFAAPEQVTGGDVTTATDVYALGVLLYMLLTGQHPAGTGTQSPADLVKAIVDTEPPRASDVIRSSDIKRAASDALKRGTIPDKLGRQLRGDLDTIVGKALKKSPAERYASVTALADDLRRYLKHEPISARPDTLSYRTAKFVRRNRTAAGLTTVALIAVIAGVAGTLIQARTARHQRDFAFGQLARAEKINNLNRFLISDASPSGKPLTINELLGRAEHIVEQENYAKDPVNHVELLVSIGTQYADTNEDEKALRVLQEAYELSRGLKDPSARARASCALGESLDAKGEYARAESLIQEGMRELPNDPQFATDRVFCLLIGAGTDAKGDAQKVLARTQSAERALNNAPIESNYLRMRVLTALAIAYDGTGQLREALEAYEQASVLVTNLGYDDSTTAASLFGYWGKTLLDTGRSIEAEKVLRKQMDIWASREEDVYPGALILYADALEQLGRLDEAASYLERACAKAGPQNSMCLNHQASVYLAQYDFGRASTMLTKLEPMARRTLPPGHYAFAVITSEQSRVAQGMGDLPKALQLADHAIEIDESSVNAGSYGLFMLPSLLYFRADIELEMHQAEKARADAERALSLLNTSLGPEMLSMHRG
jgi:eukaryotic-like serine/threonine-protein kinase